LEILRHCPDNEEVHRHIAKLGLVLKLVMKTLRDPDCGRNSPFRFVGTSHAPTVANIRA